jgi:predicted NAD/FAD-binding protein
MKPRVAIVGGGAAGLCTAWFLQHDCDVTVYESEPELGGHARTVQVPLDRQMVYAETGFKYFMDGSHRTLLALMRLLGLAPERRKTSMTIVDRVHDRTLVLPPRSPAHVVRVLKHLPLVLGLRKFMAGADQVVAKGDWGPTLAEQAEALGLSQPFIRELLLPLCASSWGAPPELIATFPAYDVMKNLWKTAAGYHELPAGISSYVAALVARLGVALKPGRAVARLLPDADGRIIVDAGAREAFDQVVVATPPWAAAQLLSALPEATEAAAVLRGFEGFDTRIVIHGDVSFMPAARGDWSMINHVFERDHLAMTEWSGRQTRRPVFRSWVPAGTREPREVYADRRFRHLAVSPRTPERQRRLDQLQGAGRVWLAGMYVTDVDDHESALLSAMRVAQGLAPASPTLGQLRAALLPSAPG